MITNTDGRTYNRTDTYDNWIKYNPVIGTGELVIENDEVGQSIKIGNGVTAYADLPYFAGAKTQVCPYAVGDIYCTLSTVKPSDRWKGTTWEELPAGRALVGQGTYTENGKEFKFTAGSTGGEAEHQLTIGELATHTHTRGTMNITGVETSLRASAFPSSIEGCFYGIINSNGKTGMTYSSSSASKTGYRQAFDASRTWTGETSEIGNNVPHNTLQPYISIFIYKRTK